MILQEKNGYFNVTGKINELGKPQPFFPESPVLLDGGSREGGNQGFPPMPRRKRMRWHVGRVMD